MSTTPDMGIYGDNVTVRIFIDGQPQGGPEYANSIKVKQEATIHKRNHLGRKRMRVGKQVDGYSVSLDMDLANTTLHDRLRARDDARDANTPVPDLNVAVKFTLRTGVEKQYVFTSCEDEPDIDAGGRDEEVKFNVSFTCEDMQAV